MLFKRANGYVTIVRGKYKQEVQKFGGEQIGEEEETITLMELSEYL